MSLDACADLVSRGDPDRFRALMAAPPATRPVLLPIYAFNLEVARAPWVTAEPMIAEMRLQWWRDALEEIATGAPVRDHEVAAPLSDVIDAQGARVLDALVVARRQDCYRDPFAGPAAFDAYIDATGGGLMWAAARALGAEAETPVRAAGRAAGMAAWFLAVPELRARGHVPYPDGQTSDDIAAMAARGLAHLWEARAGKAAIAPAARPALLAGWRAPALLRRAVAKPDRVADGDLAESEARKRGALIWAAFRRMI